MPEGTEHAIPELPPPPDVRRAAGSPARPIVLAAVIVIGACLLAVIIGITVLGWHAGGVNEVAITGLASIGATLAGGFAGWIARGQQERAPRRRTDPE